MRCPFKKQEWGGFKAAHSLDASCRVHFFFLEDSRCLPSSQELDNCMKWYWSALTHQCKALNGLFKHRINVFPFWKNLNCWLKKLWSGEMVHWVKGRTAKSDNLSMITRTHVVEDENWVLQVVLWWPHSCRGTSQTNKQMTCFWSCISSSLPDSIGCEIDLAFFPVWRGYQRCEYQACFGVIVELAIRLTFETFSWIWSTVLISIQGCLLMNLGYLKYRWSHAGLNIWERLTFRESFAGASEGQRVAKPVGNAFWGSFPI